MNTFSKVQNSVVFLYTNNENAEKEIRKIIPYIKSQKKKTYGQGMVAHIYNPSYLGGRERRITVQGQPRQKVSEILSSNQARYDDTFLWPQLFRRQR
jgi:hypothetical protein